METVIPCDFFLDGFCARNGDINPKHLKRLENAFSAVNGLKFFCKSPVEDRRDMQLPDLKGKSQLLEFAERLDSLQSVILQLIAPQIKEHARQNLPNLVVGHDNCETINDFLAAIKNRPHRKEAPPLRTGPVEKRHGPCSGWFVTQAGAKPLL